MTDIAVAVRGYLLDQTDLTDIIGTRMYTDSLPQGATLPAVEMDKLFTTHEFQLSDFAGLAHCRLQFRCYGLTRLVANSIAEAIRASGIVTQKGTTNGVDIRGCRVEEGMTYKVDVPRDGSDERRYVATIDLMIDYTET